MVKSYDDGDDDDDDARKKNVPPDALLPINKSSKTTKPFFWLKKKEPSTFIFSNSFRMDQKYPTSRVFWLRFDHDIVTYWFSFVDQNASMCYFLFFLLGKWPLTCICRVTKNMTWRNEIGFCFRLHTVRFRSTLRLTNETAAELEEGNENRRDRLVLHARTDCVQVTWMWTQSPSTATATDQEDDQVKELETKEKIETSRFLIFLFSFYPLNL